MKCLLPSLLVISLWAVTLSTAHESDATRISKRSLEKGPENVVGKFKKSSLTVEQRRMKAIKALKRMDKTESDAETGVYLDKVKSVLGKVNERTRKQLKNKNNNTKVETTKNPINDTEEGTPKSIQEVNAESDIAEYLFEGDIIVTPELLDKLEAEVSTDADRKKRAAPTRSPKWPTAAQGIIYYKFDSTLSSYKVSVIRQALQYWEDNICVNFEPATASSTNGLQFTSGAGCYSYVGVRGGFQTVSIGDGCEYFGTVAHELGHALGLLHEQSRRDRDKYIQINRQNIQNGFESQFTIMSASVAAPFTTPYDYGSIMHYDARSLTKPAMSTYDSNFQQSMGQSKGPSFYDVREMNNYLGCSAACASSRTQCQNGGYPDPKNCARCKCPLGFGGTLCDGVQSAEGTTCGGVLTATTNQQTLTSTIGTPSLTDTQQTCYWHIKSAPGTRIEVTVTSVSASCMSGCWFSALELKMGRPTGVIDGINIKSPFEGTGYRFCCTSDKINVPFVSTTNLVPVIGFGNARLQFTIRYRQVVGGAAEPSPPPTARTTTSSTRR